MQFEFSDFPSHTLNMINISIIAPVIIEMYTLWLVEDCIISRLRWL